MRKVIVLVIALCCCITSWSSCLEQIKAFYSEYMRNIMRGNDAENNALCETYMTKALIQKMQRVSRATGADAIIRAQDVNEYAIESLSVEELGEDWYLVRYFWNMNDKDTGAEIPLKICKSGDTCQIVYITPVWSGILYGDSLLSNKDVFSGEVRQESEQAFLESFYKLYLASYTTMSEDLEQELLAVRKKYLTEKATNEFIFAEQNQLADGVEGYDLLIDNFDFDCLWYKSLHISSFGDGYTVEYKYGNKVHRIVITVKRCDGNYYIDGMTIDS